MSSSNDAAHTINSKDKSPEQTTKEITTPNIYSIAINSLVTSINISIDKPIYENAIKIMSKHGIAGSRFFLSNFMQEICQTLSVILVNRLPQEEKLLYIPYVKQHVPNYEKQILNTPFKQLTDENFVSSLFKGREKKLIRQFYNWDILYQVSLYISNEKLPQNYQFAESMETPSCWTPCEDFMAITICPFLNKIEDIVDDKKLPFKSLYALSPSLKNWILNRILIIVSETVQIIPKSFKIYEKIGDKQVPRKIGDIENFKKLNSHVLYPKRLSIQMQKKLLRIVYLYGIPKKGGIKKIKEIFQNKSIHEDLITVFVVKLLKKAIHFRPDLNRLLNSFTNVKQSIINDNSLVNIDWIKIEAIKAAAFNVDLLYKIRENFTWINGIKPFENKESRMNSIELPEWKDIIVKCKWWNVDCDRILFNLTAYYGFLFNSYFALYINNSSDKDDFNREAEINSWKEREAFNLTPLKNNKFEYLDPIFSIDVKIKRLNQMLELINKARSSKKE